MNLGQVPSRVITQSELSNAFLKWVGPDDIEHTLYFQTIPDSGFSFSKSANFESIDIPGRNEPIKTWTGSGEKKIPLSLTFAAVGKKSDFPTGFVAEGQLAAFTYAKDNAYGQILQNIRLLESLVYGGRNGGAPPKVDLRFGAFFNTRATVPCIVESVDVTTGSTGVFTVDNYLPKVVTVELDLTVQHDLDEAPYYEDIIDDIDNIESLEFVEVLYREIDKLSPPQDFTIIEPTKLTPSVGAASAQEKKKAAEEVSPAIPQTYVQQIAPSVDNSSPQEAKRASIIVFENSGLTPFNGGNS